MAITQTEASELYVSTFGRASEGSGNTYWQTDQVDLLTTATVMLTTTAAIDYFGDTLDSNQEFVEHIYLNTLGKTYAEDTAGVDYWVAQLDDGGTKGQLIVDLITAAKSEGNAGDAQDQFNNKVIVSDYTADTLDAFTDTATFTAYISSVTHETSTVTAAQTSIDADVPVSGETFALTTDADPIVGTSADDLITGDGGTLNSGDLISDAYSTDSDRLNVTYNSTDVAGGATPTISGIEAINVNIDAFAGTTTTIDASNITDATITLSSSKLGYDGAAGVDEATVNSVTAGTNVTTLTVDELTTGVVDAGSATTVNITTDAATDTANVTVNSDVAVDITTGTTAVFTTTAAADIDYTAAANHQITSTTINGSTNTELSMVVADVIVGHTVTNSLTDDATLTLNVTDTGAFNATNFDVDTINLEVSVAAAATVATGANITTEVAQTSLDVTAAVATAATNAVTLTTGSDMATITTFTNIKTANVVITDDLTIDDLVTATDGTADNVVMTGTGDVTVTTTDAEKLDASGLTGALTLTTTTASAEILGGSGANDITIGAFDSSYTGLNGGDTLTALATTHTISAVLGTGADTVNLDKITTGTVVIQAGSGDDTIEFDGADAANIAAGAKITIDGGSGTDTLNFTADDDLDSATTLSVSNVEAITLESGVDITVKAAMLDGETYSISGAAGTETFGLVGLATAQTIDASNITVAATVETFTITGGALVDTITGSATSDTIVGAAAADIIDGGAGADTITGGTGADDLTGGAGDDNFVIASADSTEADMDQISDYQAAAATSDNDTLTIDSSVAGTDGRAMAVGTDILLAAGVDVKGAIAGGAGTESILGVVDDGIITLQGADATSIDTLAEWIDVSLLVLGDYDLAAGAGDGKQETVLAFEFNSNTYVVSGLDPDDSAAGDVAIDDVIELTGVTGITDVATAAAANTILIA